MARSSPQQVPVQPFSDCRVHRRGLTVAQTGFHVQLQVLWAAGGVIRLSDADKQ